MNDVQDKPSARTEADLDKNRQSVLPPQQNWYHTDPDYRRNIK